jgi:hypothetical protein
MVYLRATLLLWFTLGLKMVSLTTGAAGTLTLSATAMLSALCANVRPVEVINAIRRQIFFIYI